jgi:hypothetical protein
MKKGSSSVNKSDLDKNNFIKPTFGTLIVEDRKALELTTLRWMSSSTHVRR